MPQNKFMGKLANEMPINIVNWQLIEISNGIIPILAEAASFCC